MTSTEIAKPDNAAAVFNDDVLSRMSSFEDAIAAFKDAGIAPESVSDYGTGFSILENKAALLGVPFVILDWRFNVSEKFTDENGEPLHFVSAEVFTKHNEKWILNDGSTGIAKQLRAVTDARIERKHPAPQTGLLCEKGLTVSEYDYTDEKGRKSQASTYYLAE